MTEDMTQVVESNDNSASLDTDQYVTILISGQLFGLPIERVQDVFMPTGMTRVPLSRKEVAGVLNLRGRIVTAIDMRHRLSLPKGNGDDDEKMAVGIEYKGESYGLIIDNVGEVMQLTRNSLEATPSNLDQRWVEIAAGVHRLDGQLLVVLDVDKVLGAMFESGKSAA